MVFATKSVVKYTTDNKVKYYTNPTDTLL